MTLLLLVSDRGRRVAASGAAHGADGIRRILVALLSLTALIHCCHAADACTLQLIGESSSGQITRVDARGGTFSPSPPRDVRWRLDGDLLANAGWVSLVSNFEIITSRALENSAQQTTEMLGLIRLAREQPWSPAELKDAVVVFAWIQDGHAVWVQPLPARPPGGASTAWAAVAGLELDADMARGFPIALVQRGGAWVRPEPAFKREPVNTILAAFAFGSPEGVGEAIRQARVAPPLSKREWHDLLRWAAPLGRLDAVRALVASMPERQRDPDVLVTAAARGRSDVVSLLLGSGWQETGFHAATATGHLEIALRCVKKRSLEETKLALNGAVSLQNITLTKRLLADPRAPAAKSLPASFLNAAVATGDVDLVTTLLRQGMRASAGDGTFMLTAAARGDLAMVKLLLAEGARVDRANDDQVTALMVAASHADPEIAELLIQAGAQVNRKDTWKQTALAYALRWNRTALAELLRRHGAVDVSPREDLEPESLDIPRLFMAATDPDAAIRDVRDVDLAPVITHTEPPEVVYSGGILYEPIYSTVPVASPLERGAPIRMRQQVDYRPFGSTGPSDSDAWAIVSVVVEPDGTPSCISVVGGSSEPFRTAAAEAAWKYRFEPGERGGVAVRTRLLLAVTDRP